MKNGIVITQDCYEAEGKKIAFCNMTVFVNGASLRAIPTQNNKKLFNNACKNLGFVVGEVDLSADIPQKSIEVGE